MKQLTILSGRCLVVELPEGAIKPHINHVGSSTFIVCHTKSAGDGYNQHNIQIPIGNWQIVGMLSEVTEEQAGEIIDEPFVDNLVALGSDIEAAGFIFSTDECPNQFCENGKIDIGYGELTNCEICDESRVLSRERTLILRRVDL